MRYRVSKNPNLCERLDYPTYEVGIIGQVATNIWLKPFVDCSWEIKKTKK